MTEPMRNLEARALRAVLASTSSAVLGLDDRGRVRLANGHAQALLGLAETSGAEAPLDLSALRMVATSCDADAPIDTGRLTIVTAAEADRLLFDRAQRLYNLTCRALDVDPEDLAAPLRWIVILEDVTAERRALLDAEQLDRLGSVARLASAVAHDFNNALAAILPSVQLAQLRTEDPSIKTPLDNALAAVRRGAALAERLLNVAQGALSDEEVSLFRLDDFLGDFEKVAAAMLGRDAVFATSLPPPPPPLWLCCDRAALDAALLNLVINSQEAIRAVRRPGRVTLDAASGSLADGAPAVVLTVTDDGSGLADAVADLAFEPFFTTKREAGGVGLGLSTARAFARRIGGDLTLRPAVDRGAVATLSVPAAEPPHP